MDKKERRRYRREECFFVGLVDDKLVYVADISKGGMKLLTSEPLGKVGDVIKFNAHIPSDVLEDIIMDVKIIWTKPIEDEAAFLVGVEFVDNSPEFEKNLKYIIDLNDFIVKIRKNLLT